MAQGTLRPDLIESASRLASSNADTIKTHHNDSKLIRELRDKGRVIEPLQDFHKDEARTNYFYPFRLKILFQRDFWCYENSF